EIALFVPEAQPVLLGILRIVLFGELSGHESFLFNKSSAGNLIGVDAEGAQTLGELFGTTLGFLGTALSLLACSTFNLRVTLGLFLQLHQLNKRQEAVIVRPVDDQFIPGEDKADAQPRAQPTIAMRNRLQPAVLANPA